MSQEFQHLWPSNANFGIPPPYTHPPLFSSGMSGMPGAQHSLCPVKWGHSSSPESHGKLIEGL